MAHAGGYDDLASSKRKPCNTELRAAVETALAGHLSGAAICCFHAPARGIDFTSLVERNASADRPRLTANTAFRIASVTKVYTAAAIFRLWEENRLSLEQPISEIASRPILDALLDGGYAPDTIQVKHLLAHTGGVYDHCHDPGFVAKVLTSPQKQWTRLEQVQLAAANGAPYGPPGSRQHYSDTGYVILGDIIERASSQKLGTALRSLLKMDELDLTATHIEDGDHAAAHKDCLYHGRWAGMDTSRLHPSFDLYGGGGLVATARETAVFIRTLLTGGVFDRPETLATALAIPPEPVDPTHGRIRSYLLYRTEFLGRDCWGHTGFWGNETLYCPSLDLAVTLSVFDGAEAGRARRERLRSEIEQATRPCY